MSMSRFESLPNEILIELFEKYINGVDLFVAFRHQLNQRIDELLAKCQRLHFDFTDCRKNSFCHCIDLLPNCIERIEELSLSEQNTPAQTNAFLSFFPSFAPFKRLHKLDFHCNAEMVNWPVVKKALHSLIHTPIQTLSIKPINAYQALLWDDTILVFFRITTLRKLVLLIDSQSIHWHHLQNASSNVEHLTILGIQCSFADFELILQCIPGLKYLHIQINVSLYSNSSPEVRHLTMNPPSMIRLRTLILVFVCDEKIILEMLAKYFKLVPHLYRLIIKTHYMLFDSNLLETLLSTTLPSLSHFDLRISAPALKHMDVFAVLSSFQTPFWIEKRNYNILVTEYTPLICNTNVIDYIERFDQSVLNQPVMRWWIAPFRGINDNFSSLNNITYLTLSTASRPLPTYHYFNHIKHVVLLDADWDLIKWVLTYVNCLKIESLNISSVNEDSNTITTLLSHAKNIRALQIKFSQLIRHQKVYSQRSNFVEYLDISIDQHTLGEEDIVTIWKLFPCIKHLSINTQDLHNVSLLNNYLLHLRSLTCNNFCTECTRPISNEQILWTYKLSKKIQFWFSRKLNSLTIWIDESMSNSCDWQIFINDHRDFSIYA